MQEEVILVNEEDKEIGAMEKLDCHRQGLLHRAFSVFIFNSQNMMLLQKRAKNKYHSPGLWTNACCSHPRKGETIEQAAHRRIKEELGFDCDVKKCFSFIYQAKVSPDLIEHEFDHVFFGTYNGSLDKVNPQEVDSCRWVDIRTLKEEVEKNPEQFTAWFRIVLDRVLLHCEND
jgi:isopentenyl-diphosphate Delta-isomerase